MTGDMRRKLKEGEILFHQNDAGDSAYLVEKGRILIYLNKDKEEFPISILGEGEIIGEMALIDNERRSASVKALEDTILVVVTKDQLMERVHAADTVVRLLMRLLLKRLRRQNNQLVNMSKIDINVLMNNHSNITSTNTSLAQSDYTEGDTRAALEKIKLENRIFDAFKNREFVPFYQPIYDLNSRKMVGCEALLRWITPSNEQISPSVFMDLIENSSMILPVGRWILEKSLSDLKYILSHIKYHNHFFMSINISGKQFYDKDFLNHLESVTIENGLNPSSIKLEVTERIIAEGAIALETLQACRERGFKLAIDDFGTGFSSLQYLASMPLHDLKIDRSFVMKIKSDQKAMAIVKSLIYMAQLLGLNLIAEGIETTTELEILRNCGVRMGQGFLFSKAIPLDQFVQINATSSAA